MTTDMSSTGYNKTYISHSLNSHYMLALVSLSVSVIVSLSDALRYFESTDVLNTFQEANRVMMRNVISLKYHKRNEKFIRRKTRRK